MTPAAGHRWEFKARFRRDAFGWKSQPAMQRVKQAVAEIRKVARKDPVLAAEGAVTFLERVSPALARVDSSSGSIGIAVNNAIAELVPIIAGAPVDDRTREAWLERLWEAHANDSIPYIELLADDWGALCVSPEVASSWADRLIEVAKLAWSPDPTQRGFFHGTTACLSALLHAGRHDELLALLSEEILLSSGLADEAYRRYGIAANEATTHLATFRALARKYPHLAPAQILADLVASTPGHEGKWFAAAKDAGLLDVALHLASTRPCEPRTLTRAVRDYAESNPEFALGAGLAALHWMAEGYGYELVGLDVRAACSETLKAAAAAGRTDEVKECIRRIAASGGGANFVAKVLAEKL